MRVAILQSNYIPWRGYFDLINSVDTFVIYDEVQFTKNDWRNRNRIKTHNGIEWISIAVRQHSLSQRIDETKVVFNNWNKKHWNMLVTNYAKARQFKEVKDFLEDLYTGNTSDNLSEINVRFIKAICRYLGIETRITNSTELALTGDRNERLVDACKKLNADTYLSGPSARNYLDENLFASQGVQVDWMDYSGYAEYEQVHPPFCSEVSIVDLIMNEGSNARTFLKSVKRKQV